jgi:hypothetical protein
MFRREPNMPRSTGSPLVPPARIAENRDGLQVVGAVAGRHRLARVLGLVTTVSGELGAMAVITVGLSSGVSWAWPSWPGFGGQGQGASSEPHRQGDGPQGKAKTGVQPDIMIPVDQS